MRNEMHRTNPLTSFSCAFKGVFHLLKTQRNARVHAAAAVFVIAVGLFFGFSGTEWCLTALSIAAVFAAESLNTSIELLCDVVSPELHPLIKNTKDMAAGAVLISALGAAAVGALIIAPHAIAYLQ